MNIISSTRDNELAEMIILLSSFIKITKEQSKREITIVIGIKKTRSAIEPMLYFDNEIDSFLFTAIAKSSKDNSLTLLLDAESVIQEASSLSTWKAV